MQHEAPRDKSTYDIPQNNQIVSKATAKESNVQNTVIELAREDISAPPVFDVGTDGPPDVGVAAARLESENGWSQKKYG